jgi:hypothetical protein
VSIRERKVFKMILKAEGYLFINFLDNNYMEYHYSVKHRKNIPKVGV